MSLKNDSMFTLGLYFFGNKVLKHNVETCPDHEHTVGQPHVSHVQIRKETCTEPRKPLMTLAAVSICLLTTRAQFCLILNCVCRAARCVILFLGAFVQLSVGEICPCCCVSYRSVLFAARLAFICAIHILHLIWDTWACG